MATAPGESATSTSVGEPSEGQRRRAMESYRKLRPHLEHDQPLTRVAKELGLPLRTMQRWVSRYQRFGLAGLTRAGRADQAATPDVIEAARESLVIGTA